LLETEVEDDLVKGTEALGGECLKFVSPGRVGAPDRIILMPGRIVFAETKAPDGVLKPWQIRYHEMLRRFGFRVVTLWTKQQVSDFLLTL
jgi:hypothetical protein